MSLRHVPYAATTTPQMSFLDDTFADIATCVIVPCTASGINSIALTPNGNSPSITGYANYNKFSFTAAGNSTGSVTVSVSGLTAYPLFKAGTSTQCAAGDIVNGMYYEISYVSTLGGFVLTNAVSQGVGYGQVSNLVVKPNFSSANNKMDISANSVVLGNGTGSVIYFGSTSFTLDLATGLVTSAANGMDGEARPNASPIYIYAISNGATVAGLGSTSSTAPTLPSGYNYYVRIGSVMTDTSGNVRKSIQHGNRVQYTVISGTNTTNLVSMCSQVVGAFGPPPTWVQIPTAPYVPATASTIHISANAEAASYLAVSPSSAYTSYNIPSNPSFFLSYGGNSQFSLPFNFILETQNIYVINGSVSNIVFCSGWEDNI
jgi:hypothetical protein